jgi:hypothetical protein
LAAFPFDKQIKDNNGDDDRRSCMRVGVKNIASSSGCAITNNATSTLDIMAFFEMLSVHAAK